MIWNQHSQNWVKKSESTLLLDMFKISHLLQVAKFPTAGAKFCNINSTHSQRLLANESPGVVTAWFIILIP